MTFGSSRICSCSDFTKDICQTLQQRRCLIGLSITQTKHGRVAEEGNSSSVTSGVMLLQRTAAHFYRVMQYGIQ